MSKFNVIAYTDGACKGNPGIGGWGFFYQSKEIKSTSSLTLEWSDFGGSEYSTNNIMELQAMIECLNSLPNNSTADIYTDSKYVLLGMVSKSENVISSYLGHYDGLMNRWIKSGWTKPKKNIDLWKTLDKSVQDCIKRGIVLKIIWVKGHSGDWGNDKADALANKGVDEIRNKEI